MRKLRYLLTWLNLAHVLWSFIYLTSHSHSDHTALAALSPEMIMIKSSLLNKREIISLSFYTKKNHASLYMTLRVHAVLPRILIYYISLVHKKKKKQNGFFFPWQLGLFFQKLVLKREIATKLPSAQIPVLWWRLLFGLEGTWWNLSVVLGTFSGSQETGTSKAENVSWAGILNKWMFT